MALIIVFEVWYSIACITNFMISSKFVVGVLTYQRNRLRGKMAFTNLKVHHLIGCYSLPRPIDGDSFQWGKNYFYLYLQDFVSGDIFHS